MVFNKSGTLASARGNRSPSLALRLRRTRSPTFGANYAPRRANGYRAPLPNDVHQGDLHLPIARKATQWAPFRGRSSLTHSGPVSPPIAVVTSLLPAPRPGASDPKCIWRTAELRRHLPKRLLSEAVQATNNSKSLPRRSPREDLRPSRRDADLEGHKSALPVHHHGSCSEHRRGILIDITYTTVCVSCSLLL